MTKEDLVYKDYLPTIKNPEFFQEYLDLLEPYITNPIPKTERTQTHHIVFKCYLKTNEQKKDIRNLVEIPQNVHMRAHILFWKAVRDRKSCWACYRFKEGERKANATPEESEELLAQFRQESSKIHKGKKLTEKQIDALKRANSAPKTKATKQRMSVAMKGKHSKEYQTSMYDPVSKHWHWVLLEDVEQNKRKGWVMGRGPMSENQRRNISQRRIEKGIKNPCKGRKKIHKGLIIKMVQPEELENFLKEGWELGDPKEFHKNPRRFTEKEKEEVSKRFKGKKQSKEQVEKAKEARKMKNGIKLEKEGEIVYSWKYELSSYLESGWKVIE